MEGWLEHKEEQWLRVSSMPAMEIGGFYKHSFTLVTSESIEGCYKSQIRALEFDISFMLNYTDLKTWIFCCFYVPPPHHLHPFNLRCSIAQQTKDAARTLRALQGRGAPCNWRQCSSGRASPLFHQRPLSLPPTPWALKLLIWQSGWLDPIFDIPLSPSGLCILYLIMLMPKGYSWKEEGKLIINRTFPLKISGTQEKWFTYFLTRTIRNVFLCGRRDIEKQNQKRFLIFSLFPFKLQYVMEVKSSKGVQIRVLISNRCRLGLFLD